LVDRLADIASRIVFPNQKWFYKGKTPRAVFMLLWRP